MSLESHERIAIGTGNSEGAPSTPGTDQAEYFVVSTPIQARSIGGTPESSSGFGTGSGPSPASTILRDDGTAYPGPLPTAQGLPNEIGPDMP